MVIQFVMSSMVSSFAKGLRSNFRCILRKHRKDNIPVKGEIGKDSKPIDLEDEEGIIEPLHFLIYRKNCVLVIQNNRNAGNENIIAQIYSEFLKRTIIFDAIVSAKELELLLKNKSVKARKISLKIAKPKQIPTLSPKDLFDSSVMSLLDGGGSSINIDICGNGKTKIEGDRYIGNGKIHEILKAIKSTKHDFRRAKLDLEEDDEFRQVDLIFEQIKQSFWVDCPDRFPDPALTFLELEKVYQSQQKSLNEIFGG